MSTDSNKEKPESISSASSFDLRSDIFKFSSRMNDADTIKIMANLSACESWHHETNILTKRNNRIFVNTMIEADYIDEQKLILDEVEYKFIDSDTLNFENLLKYLNTKAIKYKKSNSPILSIIYKQDTITYYSESLGDHLENGEYYILIKRKLYPSEQFYKPILNPPLPPAPKNENDKSILE